MIEELKEKPLPVYEGRGKTRKYYVAPNNLEMMHKVNELVQRVNVLSKALAITMERCVIPLVDRVKIHQMLNEAGLHIGDGDIDENNKKD